MPDLIQLGLIKVELNSMPYFRTTENGASYLDIMNVDRKIAKEILEQCVAVAF